MTEFLKSDHIILISKPIDAPCVSLLPVGVGAGVASSTRPVSVAAAAIGGGSVGFGWT